MMKRFFILLVIAILTVSFVACGSGDGNNLKNDGVKTGAANGTSVPEDTDLPDQIAGGKPITLLVDLNNFTPTEQQEATAESPNVFVSSQLLANKFMEMYPNVKIEWYRNKVLNNTEAALEWITTTIAAESAPDIVFIWGAKFADRGWFMKLDDVLQQPNEYMEGNEKWIDIFPEYLWEDTMQKDSRGNIVALPLTVYPGPATAIYYNKEIFEKVGAEIPKDWETFIETCKKLKDAGYTAFAPWGPPGGGNRKPNIENWDMQFSLGGAFAKAVFPQMDYNQNGKLDPEERIRWTYEGKTLLSKNDNSRDLFYQMKRKYTEVLDTGFANRDYETAWLQGKVAMLEDGLWRYPNELSNTSRPFEFGLFPPPIITTETSEYVAEIEYTESGPYQPQTMEAFNILEPSINSHGGEDVREAAIKFLKFLSAPENLSAIIMELKGTCIGAVKGTEIPTELNEWFKNSFPKLPNYGFVVGAGIEGGGTANLNKEFEMWIKEMKNNEDFYKDFDAIIKKSVEEYVKSNNIDTSGWNKGW